MKKELTKEEVIQNKKEAIRALNNMLELYINSSNDKHLKKANLLSYWIKDYVRMIRFEENFEPTKNIAYKRGNLVKVNFGFRVGAEYGGLHYGIVLDNHNDHNSPVVTVIPLTSSKDTEEIHENNVDEVYRSLKIKYDTISKALKEEQEEIQNELNLFKTMVDLATQTANELESGTLDSQAFKQKLSDVRKYLDAAKELKRLWEEKAQHNKEQQDYLNKIGLEISRMKEGSIALVNQITTISKIRIFDPRNLKGVLSGISLSEEGMKKINQKVKELYVFKE